MLGTASFPALFSNWEICLTKSGGFCKTLWDPELTEGNKKSSFAYRLIPYPLQRDKLRLGLEQKKRKKKSCRFMGVNTLEFMISAISFGENPVN